MNRQPNRLAAGEHRFNGSQIDRARPLGFRLDGREVRGFAGDTLLSALLASGVTAAGWHEGAPLALDERFAPPVLLRGQTHDRLRALSLERTPAADGLDLVTLAHSRRGRAGQAASAVRGWLPRRRAGLHLSYDSDVSPIEPWFDAPPERELKADLAVVGGGLAGMAAAVAAAKRGGRIVLVERRTWLGGEARFFGTESETEGPDELVSKLAATIAAQENILVLYGAEAFAVFEGAVRVNQVEIADGIPASRSLSIVARRVVLANGCIERLPVFAGNRRPGVVGAAAAFNRADRFGVWIGRRAMLATATNVGYRVAMPAIDAGVAIERIADSRLDPQSRFIAFSKAYGIAMARSLLPRGAQPAGRRGGLTVDFEHGPGEGERPGERHSVEQLVVSGGWQPDLTLWHMAGGGSRWQPEQTRLEAEGMLPGIALAGSVGGYRSAAACLKSGQAAVALLFGRSVPDVEDVRIDPIYETPDGPTPIGAVVPDADAGAYLDGGTSLTARPMPIPAWRRLWTGWRTRRWSLAEQARPLGVADVAAGVQLGLIAPAEAAIVAQERCVTPGDIVDAGRVTAPSPEPGFPMSGTPPDYLAGRFGPKPATWLAEPADGRAFEIGCLVYPDAETADPLAAIGVVFAPAPAGRTGGLVLVAKAHAEGSRLTVRDVSGPVPVRLVDASKPVEQPQPGPATTAAPPKPVAPPKPSPAVAATPEIGNAVVTTATIQQPSGGEIGSKGEPDRASA